MSDEQSNKGEAKTSGEAAPSGEGRPSARAPDAAPAGEKPAKPKKGGTPGNLRTGGCLIALLVFVALLGVFALVYRPPTPPTTGPQSWTDSGTDAEPVNGPALRAVAVSPDGTLVAGGGEESVDGRWVIRLLRVAEHKFVDRERPLRLIDAHAAPIRALLFRPDGRELFSASLDGTVGWWRVETGERISTLEPPGAADETKGLLVLAASGDGRYLAAGGWSGDVYVWDLSSAGATPAVFRSGRGPWAKDPKDIKPAGLIEEVHSLAFVPGVPPLLVVGGGEGLLAVWDVEGRKPGRIVTADGKLPNVRDLMMRQWQFQRDEDFVITALLSVPARQGVLAADYRGCVYQLTTEGPCRGWWLGVDMPTGPVTCIKPVLDKKKFCVPFERTNDEAEAVFLGLFEYPGLAGGYASISWNDRFRIFRAADAVAWRRFEGATQRGEWMCTFAAATAQGFVVTGGEAGRLRLYELLGDPTMPDIRLGDQL